MCSYYLANEYIFHVGDEADAFYIVLNGSVRVLVPLSNTKFESTPIDSEAENDEVMITQ